MQELRLHGNCKYMNVGEDEEPCHSFMSQNEKTYAKNCPHWTPKEKEE
jgi:hypothetical protein